MYTIIIQGVPVLADPALSPEAIRKIVMELIQSWAWEGRPLGKIELICDKTWIHIVTYEQPSNQVIPWKNCTDEE